MLTRAVSYVQLAGVVLKGYINAHWDSADLKFVEPQTTPQDKVRLAPAPLLYLCTPWVGLHDDRRCAFGRRPSVRHCPRDSLIPRARSVRRRYYCTPHLSPSTLEPCGQMAHTHCSRVQAMAIASIAHWDWPGEWPNLIEELGDEPTFTHGPRACIG